jgi:hypothetical protein
MKSIKLICGKVYQHEHEAQVDDSDYSDLNQFNWHAEVNKKTGQVLAFRYGWLDGRCLRVYLHRQIVGCAFNSKIIVEFANQNTLDCTYANLICTSALVKQRERNEKAASDYWERFRANQDLSCRK